MVVMLQGGSASYFPITLINELPAKGEVEKAGPQGSRATSHVQDGK